MKAYNVYSVVMILSSKTDVLLYETEYRMLYMRMREYLRYRRHIMCESTNVKGEDSLQRRT